MCILSQCVQQSSRPVGRLQGLGFSCAWPLLAIFTVALVDHCLCWITTLVAIFAVCFLCWSEYMDYCFDCLLCHFSTPPFPPLIRIILVNGILVSGQERFSTEVPSVWQCWLVVACRAGSRSKGCHGTSLLCLAFLHDPNQPLMAPGFPSSSIGDEFKIHKIKEKHYPFYYCKCHYWQL